MHTLHLYAHTLRSVYAEIRMAWMMHLFRLPAKYPYYIPNIHTCICLCPCPFVTPAYPTNLHSIWIHPKCSSAFHALALAHKRWCTLEYTLEQHYTCVYDVAVPVAYLCAPACVRYNLNNYGRVSTLNVEYAEHIADAPKHKHGILYRPYLTCYSTINYTIVLYTHSFGTGINDARPFASRSHEYTL